MPRFSKSELLNLQKKFKTDAEIGKKFGITRQAVHIIRKFYGIPPIPGARTVFPPPRITRDELIKLQKKFITDKAIGEKIGISRNHAFIIRKKYGIPAILPDIPKRNAAIVALYKKGLIGRALADKFGLHLITIYNIISDAGAGKRKAARVNRTAMKKRK